MNGKKHIAEALTEAWDVLYDSLPDRWHIGMPRYDTERTTWSVTAWGPGVAGGVPSQSVTGIGDSEPAALRDLDSQLRRLPRPNRARLNGLRHQLGIPDVDAAEALS